MGGLSRLSNLDMDEISNVRREDGSCTTKHILTCTSEAVVVGCLGFLIITGLVDAMEM